ncbi:YggS family pyridoxal phosphate-dependent enzyme [Halalkalibacter urbisdiaboli]|uniref:YggS family pyridoxal phosphate-dependent enzyme n=1 Tax=Halalkalibacter urbisdiaboli TaxID=1960589 RepID=UPI000B43741A|nr:YggS family pyridoxal phosphate-dependent enzyme [Halalkalibacter urbisdiaboli]
MTIKEKLTALQTEIEDICNRINRDPGTVHIVAVTKYVSEERTKEALDAGIVHIGENRAESGVEKWEALHERGVWHFIGSLQSKKVKKIIDKFSFIHSLDRLSLAEELDKRCPDGQKVICFVQVNVSGEETKAGLHPEEVVPFIKKLMDFHSIEVIGLMTMAPFEDDPEKTRPVFRELRKLRDHVSALNLKHAPCKELSMGMSNDFRIALEEGATYIRIGSALVGADTK